jgi:hypothetical protein
MDILNYLTAHVPPELSNQVVKFLPSSPSAKIIKTFLGVLWHDLGYCTEYEDTSELLEYENIKSIIDWVNDYERRQRIQQLPKHPLAMLLKEFMEEHDMDPDEVEDFSFSNWFKETMLEDHINQLYEEWQNEQWEANFG